MTKKDHRVGTFAFERSLCNASSPAGQAGRWKAAETDKVSSALGFQFYNIKFNG